MIKYFMDFNINSNGNALFCPWEMQNAVLNSGLFKVIEGRKEIKRCRY